MRGIKREPIIAKNLFYFDTINHFGIDYMHTVCLNVFKHFITYWFEEQYKENRFSLYLRKQKVEDHYKECTFPHFKTRKARKLEEFKDWKAIELR